MAQHRQSLRQKIVDIRARHWLLISLAALFLFALSGGLYIVQSQAVLPVRVVAVHGYFSHTERSTIRDAVMPLVESGVLGVDLSSIQQRLQDMPWIDQVRVKKVWPDTIRIDLTEKIPFARWGEDALITEQGDVFKPDLSRLLQRLPVLFGPLGQQRWVLANFKQMQHLLKRVALQPMRVEVDHTGAWRVWIDNGLRIELGSEQVLVRLLRLVKAFPKLVADKPISRMAYIDLRYANGLAVRWQRGRTIMVTR